MRHNIQTFNGHTINDGVSYQTTLLNPNTLPAAQLTFVSQPNADAIDAGMYTVESLPVALSIKVNDYANRYALIAQLQRWFRRGSEGDLVIEHELDGFSYFKPCRVVSLVQNTADPQVFNALLSTGWTSWRRSGFAESQTYNISGTGGSQTISVGGEDETPLSMWFTMASSSPGLYLYQRNYQILAADRTKPATGYGPWCITIDTASLVTAGKMQADCDDLRILVDGIEVKRWLANPNNASTKAWFHLKQNKGYWLKLRTALDNSTAYDTLEFEKTPDTSNSITEMPAEGIVVHGTEWIRYRKGTDKYSLALVERGILGTSMQAHSVGDTMKFMEHVITVFYGQPAALRPDLNDADYDLDKPCFSLSASTNSSWVYTASDAFWDSNTTGRTGGFTPAIVLRSGKGSSYYASKNDNPSLTDPVMGMRIQAYQVASGWQPERAKITWSLYRGCGINTTTVTGQKYKSGNTWPAVAGLENSADGSTFASVWNEAAPGSNLSWTALATHSAVAMGDLRWVRFILDGMAIAGPDQLAKIEIQTLTVNFTSANVPAASLLGENSNAEMDFSVTNQTTGDTIYIKYSALLHKVLKLDGETNTITFNDTIYAHEAISLDDESRGIWIRLVPGNNVIVISSENLGTMEVVLRRYWRRF